MSRRKQTESKRNSSLSAEQQAQGGAPSADPTLERAMRHVASGHYERALNLLDAAGRDAPIRNARGVCLLRMGRYEDATRVLRELVLSPGCTWMRSDIPTLYKTNFATALFLGGHPAGCLEILAEIHEEKHPSVQRLRSAIKSWEKRLSWLQWLNWKISRVEPARCRASVELPAGEFESEVSPAEPEQPETTPTPPMRTAV
jgi:hypothetical protein